MKDEKKPTGEMEDVLDQIKAIERAVKAQTLMKILSSLKKYAREILVLKEKTTIMLEELGISDTDAKRIIDFINNSSEVQLSETDLKKIREEMKETVSEKKSESQEVIEKKMTTLLGNTTSTYPLNFVGYSQVQNADFKFPNYKVGQSYRSNEPMLLSTANAMLSSLNGGSDDFTESYATGKLSVSSSNGQNLDISL